MRFVRSRLRHSWHKSFISVDEMVDSLCATRPQAGKIEFLLFLQKKDLIPKRLGHR